MHLIYQYTLKKMIIVIFSLTLILIGAVWLTQSLRFIEVIVNHSVSLTGYFSLVIYLVPDLMATILPICVLIASLHVYQKMTIEHELHAIRALGFSNLQIAAPLLFVSSLITIFIYIINVYVTPLSFQNFREQEHRIRNQFSSSLLREGVFNVLQGITIYIRERGTAGELKGILIHHVASPKDERTTGDTNSSYTVIAETGQLQRTKDTFVLILKKGMRQEKDLQTGKISVFSFDDFVYDLTSKISKSKDARIVKPYEKTLYELFHPDPSEDPTLKARMRVEGHQRLLTPWFSIVNALIASIFTLLTHMERRQRRSKIALAVLCAICLEGTTIALLNLSSQNPHIIYAAYSLIALALIGGCIALERGRLYYKFVIARKRSNV